MRPARGSVARGNGLPRAAGQTAGQTRMSAVDSSGLHPVTERGRCSAVDELGHREAGQLRDVADPHLEGPERPEGRRRTERTRELVDVDERRLVDDEARRREPLARVPRRDLPELQRDPDAAVRRVVVGQHRAREHAQLELVHAGVLEHVVLQPQPQLARLVEPRGLRCRVREPERVGVRPRRDRRVAPHRVVPAHEVAAVEVVVGVDLGPGLQVGRDALVELPPVLTRHLHEPCTVDVHGRDPGEAPEGVEHHREVLVGEFHGCRGLRVAHPRHDRRHPEELGVEARGLVRLARRGRLACGGRCRRSHRPVP